MDQIFSTGGASFDAARGPLVVGLVNSMPGEARPQTERQFRALLTAAAGDAAVALRLFALDAEPGGGGDVAALEQAGLDGLIVTGMAPRAAFFPDEPYWPAMARLIEHARTAALPTMWSCLAAHAAVFHLDGIARQRLPRKLSGLVACARSEPDHPLLAGLPEHWQVPHSRYNDVPEAALRARGYRILSRMSDGSADIFAKDDAPFLFCQGHPEYDAAALLREYRRDIRQFVACERDDYPEAPRGCFGAEVTAQLDTFRERALSERTIDVLDTFPMAACAADLRHAWREVAAGLYGNWLEEVATRRAGRDVCTDPFRPSGCPATVA